jgi:predicted P-loop ATPase
LLKLRAAILRQFGFDPGKEYLADALKNECLDHAFDPVRDYLDSLQWDGVSRVDNWLTRYCRAADTPLNRAFGRKVLIAAVRRVRQPGCKFDFILVLEGDQGIGKSTLLRILTSEENFSDNEILGLEKREQQEAVQGVWIYEIGELEGMRKADVTHTKLFASKTHDSARPAWGRSRVDRPRRCILIATTNDDTYLRDTTGNRRFWPVKVSRIDLDAVARDRDQIWAEAAVLEAQGEALAIGEEHWSAAAVQQKARRDHDPWEDLIATRLANTQKTYASHASHLDGKIAKAPDENGDFEWRVASSWLLTDVLSISKDRQVDAMAKRLTGVMRELNWHRPENSIRIGKTVARGFVKKEMT